MSLPTKDTTSVPTAVLLRGRGRKVPPKAVGSFLMRPRRGAHPAADLGTRDPARPGAHLGAATGVDDARDRSLLGTASSGSAMGQTLFNTFLGIIISTAIALPLGTLIGLNSTLHRLLYATIEVPEADPRGRAAAAGAAHPRHHHADEDQPDRLRRALAAAHPGDLRHPQRGHRHGTPPSRTGSRRCDASAPS